MSVREVGTNPFIIGDKSEEGNRFYEFLKANEEGVQAFILNTGGVGEIAEVTEGGKRVVKQKVLRVEIPEMAAIIRGIARGTIRWCQDRYWNLEVPERVEGVDISKFDPAKFYPEEEVLRMVDSLRKERVEYLRSFKDLRPEIIEKGGF
jgi:phosphoenolpyruvate carboxykinase (ATP)